MLGAFFCFAVMDTSAKWLVSVAVLPAIQVVFARYFVHFLWVLLLYLPKHGRALFRSGAPKTQLLRGLLLLSSTALNFTALKFLPLTVTIAIFFATPMVVCLLSVPVLGERVGLKRFAAVCTGFIGVLVIVQPWGETFDWHVLISLGALLTASAYFVVTRKAAGIDTNAVAQFYISGTATTLLLPVVVTSWRWPASGSEVLLMVLLGSLGMLGHSLLSHAHHYAEASVLAPTVYSQILYITVLSWLIFDSVPDFATATGTVIIVLSGLFIWWRERALQQSAAIQVIR
jgi:drug/metabolite transporter (DMT)-like permease